MIELKFTGPGGFGYEVEIVRRALIEAGVRVHLSDGTELCGLDAPWAQDTNLIQTDQERMKKFLELMADPQYQKWREVRIVCDHQPWGG
jgi:hypothetical protein